VKAYNFGVWLVLVIAEAGGQAAARIRVWRALKALGAAVVRDGVYLLPDRDDLRVKLAEQRAEIIDAGGHALLFAAPGIDPDDTATFRQFFDRSADYAAIAASARGLGAEIGHQPEGKARRALRALQRRYENVESIDYFRTPARSDASNEIAAAKAAFTARFSRYTR